MNRPMTWLAIAIIVLTMRVSPALATEESINNAPANTYFNFLRLWYIASSCGEHKLVEWSNADEKNAGNVLQNLFEAALKSGISQQDSSAFAQQFLFGEEYSMAARFMKYVEQPVRPIQLTPGGFRYQMSRDEWEKDKADKKSQLTAWCTKADVLIRKLMQLSAAQ